MLNLTPHERLVVARKRLAMDQLEASKQVQMGFGDYVAIEKGRTVPSHHTPEGLRILTAIEDVFGIPTEVWTKVSH